MIRAGQKLVIFVPDDKMEYYKRINNLSFNAKTGVNGENGFCRYTLCSGSKTTVATAGSDDNYIYHTVQRGDNFWTIARQYPG